MDQVFPNFSEKSEVIIITETRNNYEKAIIFNCNITMNIVKFQIIKIIETEIHKLISIFH